MYYYDIENKLLTETRTFVLTIRWHFLLVAEREREVFLYRDTWWIVSTLMYMYIHDIIHVNMRAKFNEVTRHIWLITKLKCQIESQFPYFYSLTAQKNLIKITCTFENVVYTRMRLYVSAPQELIK